MLLSKSERKASMGLAATQARFLGITARKTSCEFQSMQIAQSKLALTRDQMRATDQHNAAMKATKLVWESGYGDPMDLSYNLMMHPSALNDYQPFLITNSSGRVVLNGKLAAAMKAAGFSKNQKISMTEANYQKFVDALGEGNSNIGGAADVRSGTGVKELPNSISNAIITLERDKGLYSNTLGFGAPPPTMYSDTMNINNIVLYIDQVMQAARTPEHAELTDKVNQTAQAFNCEVFKTFDANINAGRNGSSYNGDVIAISDTFTSAPTFTLSDLLKGDVSYLKLSSGTTGTGTPKLDDFKTWLNNAFKALLPGNEYDSNALWFAGQTLDKYLQTVTSNQAIQTNNDTNLKKNVDASEGVYGWVQNVALGANGEASYKASAAGVISLSNLARAFLTGYQNALNSYSSMYSTGTTVAKSNTVTDNIDQLYYIKNVFNASSGSGSGDSEEVYLYNNFYNTLFNNICANGWVDAEENDYNVDDKEYLAHALKNGQLFVSSLNTDGYYYQDEYTRNGYIVEVADVDKIAQAEAEYEVAKGKLNYKEEMLDMEMKNLDMEIASLSAEYDSVKGMISKNTEKIFNMFQ
jgi:hypothetical protein